MQRKSCGANSNTTTQGAINVYLRPSLKGNDLCCDDYVHVLWEAITIMVSNNKQTASKQQGSSGAHILKDGRDGSSGTPLLSKRPNNMLYVFQGGICSISQPMSLVTRCVLCKKTLLHCILK